jgi:hypothetical protein
VKGKKLATKNRYQQSIAEYTKRRNKVQERFDVVAGRKAPDGYYKAVSNIDRKIKMWKQALRRIEKQENSIKQLDKLIIEFVGLSVKDSSHKRTKQYNIARAIFYRHGMEAKISSRCMVEYTGMKCGKVWRSRILFIRSFKTNLYNREMWYRWKEFSQRDDLKQAA